MEDVRSRPRLRSASTHCILRPRVQTSTGQRSFAYSGPAVWNSLPPASRENMSLATLRTKLKTYLFRRSQWLSKTTRRCCGVFAIPAPRYKWLYLLTCLLQELTTSGPENKIPIKTCGTVNIFSARRRTISQQKLEKKNSGPFSAIVANNRYDRTHSRKAVGHGHFELRITLSQS